jgi:hypothetical protein
MERALRSALIIPPWTIPNSAEGLSPKVIRLRCAQRNESSIYGGLEGHLLDRAKATYRHEGSGGPPPRGGNSDGLYGRHYQFLTHCIL